MSEGTGIVTIAKKSLARLQDPKLKHLSNSDKTSLVVREFLEAIAGTEKEEEESKEVGENKVPKE